MKNIAEDNKIKQTTIEAIESKKGKDITIVDVKGLSTITDKFILCSGESVVQVGAICDEIEKKLSENFSVKPYRIDGRTNDSGWIVMDYIDFMVHIFHDKKREIYNLERLWNMAPIEYIKTV